ncbi:DUF3383 family protein [Vibrio parahaemolyticus]|nr:DUF3383 family protein [Vibrio parahaemolyticus]MDF4668719.1 DUF3383 family protein [Vibrio parahaemolyticus]HAV1412732.1 DUF3383 family protein [Vibrio parahaemolyticus]HAV2004814.1 DUF3383 family protein [Vibrio parahaemolyticus]
MAISSAVPAGAIAHAVGAEIVNVNLRTGLTLLPNQIAVLGQASSDSVGVKFNQKQQVTSGAEAGERWGFGSPLHLMCEQLFPRSNDGVTADIPVNVYPLEDPEGATAATGAYEVYGIATKTVAATIKVNNRNVNAVINKGDVAEDVIAAIKAAIDNDIKMPIITETSIGVPATHATLIGAAAPASPDTLSAADYELFITVDGEPLTVSVDLSAAGDELAIASTLQTAINNAGGLVTASWDATNEKYEIATDSTGVTSQITTVSDSGSGTTGLAAGLKLDSDSGAIVSEGTDETPSTVAATAKWLGETGNEILLDVEVDECGITFVIQDMAGGLLVPDVDPALDNFKDCWNSYVVNQFGFNDEVFDKYQTMAESRWDGMIGKPFVAIYGDNRYLRDDLLTPAVGREQDRTNICVPVYGSVSLPFEIAARAVGMFASRAQGNPARPYIGMRMTGIAVGTDVQQLGYTDRNTLEEGGISTTLVEDGVAVIQDVMTFYRPTGVVDPGHKYLVDLMKSFNWIFNLMLTFKSDKWKGVILVKDSDRTTNEFARKPSAAKNDLYALVDSFADNAIIVDRDFAKENCAVELDDQNPNRFNTKTTVKYSGAGRIFSNTLAFGFDVS